MSSSALPSFPTLMPLLAGCGEKLSKGEARQVLVSIEHVMRDVETTSLSATTPTSLTLEPEGDTWSVMGTCESDDWSGTLTALGNADFTADTVTYDLDLTWMGIESDGVRLDGQTHWAFEFRQGSESNYEATWSLVGVLEATGAVHGTAHLEYSLEFCCGAPPRVGHSYHGTINEWELPL